MKYRDKCTLHRSKINLVCIGNIARIHFDSMNTMKMTGETGVVEQLPLSHPHIHTGIGTPGYSTFHGFHHGSLRVDTLATFEPRVISARAFGDDSS